MSEKKKTPWGKIIGCGCLIIVLGIAGCGAACVFKGPELALWGVKKGFADLEYGEGVTEKTHEDLKAKLDKASDALGDSDDDMGEKFVKLAPLMNVVNAIANDRTLTSAEADDLNLLLDVYIAKGEISLTEFREVLKRYGIITVTTDDDEIEDPEGIEPEEEKPEKDTKPGDK